MVTRHKLDTVQDFLRVYPRLCAHVICEGLGKAPRGAAHQRERERKGKEGFDADST
jgi:hypothetical protein